MDTVKTCGRSSCGYSGCFDCFPVTQPIASDGGSSGYYVLPPEATELRHLIQARKMNFSIGNIFKACWRLGLKAGTEKYYDLRKMVFFVLDEYEADGREVYKAELNKLKDHINKELARVG